MKPIALIYNGVWSQQAFAGMSRYREAYDLVYTHDFDAASLGGYRAVVVPFQSNQAALAARREALFSVLRDGRKLVFFGDTTPEVVPAIWAYRHVNNYWWKTDPDNPPVAWTDHEHPVYRGLSPRHARWHNHGVYTAIPKKAAVIQTNGEGEVITWQTHEFGGTLFASTKDPIVEHGIQQIRHLHNYCDKLTEWLVA